MKVFLKRKQKNRDGITINVETEHLKRDYFIRKQKNMIPVEADLRNGVENCQ